HADLARNLGHAGVDAATKAFAAVKGDQTSVVDAGHIHCRLNGIFQITDLVDQLEFLGIGAGVDPAVGELAHLVFGQSPPFGNDLDELAVETINHALENGPLFGCHGPGRVAQVFVGPGLDRIARQADFREQAAGVVQAHDDANAACGGGRVCINPVAPHRQVISAAGSHVHHASNDRFAGFFAEVDQILIHDVAGGHGAAGTVDAQD